MHQSECSIGNPMVALEESRKTKKKTLQTQASASTRISANGIRCFENTLLYHSTLQNNLLPTMQKEEGKTKHKHTLNIPTHSHQQPTTKNKNNQQALTE
jgi:hypothetical protein